MRTILVALWALISLPVLAQEVIVVEGAYAYPPIGAGNVSAAYMTLANPSEQPYRLVMVSSEVYGHIELHSTLMEDGMMKMRELPEIDLPPGKTVTLESGGLHLMLMDAKGEIKPGDVIELKLHLNKMEAGAPEWSKMLSVQTLQLPVKARR